MSDKGTPAKVFKIPTYDVLLDGQTFENVRITLADRAAYEDVRAQRKWPVDAYSAHTAAFWCWRSLTRAGRIGISLDQFLDKVEACEIQTEEEAEGPTLPAQSAGESSS